MSHDLTQFAQVRQATRDVHKSFAFGRRQPALGEEKAVLELVGNLLLNPLALTCSTAGKYLGVPRRLAALSKKQQAHSDVSLLERIVSL